jgi:hypothetical protein
MFINLQLFVRLSTSRTRVVMTYADVPFDLDETSTAGLGSVAGRIAGASPPLPARSLELECTGAVHGKRKQAKQQ